MTSPKSARVWFRELASLFRETLFMNLVSYADESGTHDPRGVEKGSDVAGIVGYISDKENWENFCGQWKEVLDRYNVKEFHMSVFANEKEGPKDPNWPYHGWDRNKKDKFIRELIPIARDNTMFAVGGFVDVKAHHATMPQWLKSEADNFPYYICFQAFFDQLLAAIPGMRPPLDISDQVAFFFGQQDQFKETALRLFGQVKQLRDPEDRMGTITFASNSKYLPLQAADLIAYRMRKMVSRRLGGKPEASKGSWDAELESRHNLIIGYITADKLQPVIDKIIAVRLKMIAKALKKI